MSDEPDEFRCKCGLVAASELALKKHQRRDCPIYRLIRIQPVILTPARQGRGQFMKECPYCHKQISNAWFRNHKRCCARWGSDLGKQATSETRRTHKRMK